MLISIDSLPRPTAGSPTPIQQTLNSCTA